MTPDKLKEEIALGRVVIVAGTGVSIAACGNQKVDGHAVASWPGLLQHGLAYCEQLGIVDEEEVELLRPQVTSTKVKFLISAAEHISAHLRERSPGTYHAWLADSVGKLQVSDPDLAAALLPLSSRIITLNYDRLIELATGRQHMTWLKPNAVQQVLRGDRDEILHLHGYFDEPESVVLGLNSYEKVRNDPHTQSVLQFLTLHPTLLFVGCGGTLEDPNFSRLVEWGQAALKDVVPRHVLLCRESELDSRRKDLHAAPWLHPLSYGRDYSDLLPFLQALAPDRVSPAPAPVPIRVSTRPPLELEPYRAAMRKRYGRLRLEELDPTTHDVKPLTLTGMFIPQSAREAVEFLPRVFELPKELQGRLREAGEIEECGLDEQMLEEHRRAYLDQSPQPVLEILADPANTRVVVLGDPGSGKSTLLQYLLLESADAAMAGDRNNPLYLLIELREYARYRSEANPPGLLEYLQSSESVRWQFDRDLLDTWLRSNPGVVLFDGLDEVFDPTLRSEVITAIHRFCDEYPIRAIVTSRIIGFQHQAWRDEGFRHFVLQDLDNAQIDDFLTRWHTAAYDDPHAGRAKRDLLSHALQDSAAIRQLAGNPLLLTMMAILNRTQDLPRDRAELYEQCARLLLHQWKVDAAFNADPELEKASLDFKDKRQLLMRVARGMLTTDGLASNIIDEETLEHHLADGLRNIPNLRPDRAARALIEQLRGRNFMLSYLGGRAYAFVHRTFLEYFCAVEIRERFQTEQILTLEQLKCEIFAHWPDETWHEVLMLLAGMLAPRFTKELIGWLLEQDDPHQSRIEQDDSAGWLFAQTSQSRINTPVILAIQCVGEVRKVGELEPVATAVRKRAESLLHAPPDQGGYSALQNVVRLIARVWGDVMDVKTWLKQTAASTPDAAVFEAAAEELAERWGNEPEVAAWLEDQLHSHHNPLFRERALSVLARGGREDPDVLHMLISLVRSDEHWAVRGTAVQELEKGWTEDPSVVQLIRERVCSDPEWFLRGLAVISLTSLARGPETVDLLKSAAATESHEKVLEVITRELTIYWPGDLAIQEILQKRTLEEGKPALRHMAVQLLIELWPDDSSIRDFVSNLDLPNVEPDGE
jgi:GTPase SAR1 family protein